MNQNNLVLYDTPHGESIDLQKGYTPLNTLTIKIGSIQGSIFYAVNLLQLSWTTVPCNNNNHFGECSLLRSSLTRTDVSTDENGHYYVFQNTQFGYSSIMLNIIFSRNEPSISYIFDQNTGGGTVIYPISMYFETLEWLKYCSPNNNPSLKLTSYISKQSLPRFRIGC